MSGRGNQIKTGPFCDHAYNVWGPGFRLRALMGSRGRSPPETKVFSHLKGLGNPNLVNKISLKFCKNVAFLWQFEVTLEIEFEKC